MAKKIKTKRKILEAAKTIFAKKGFDGSSVDEIASEAGVKKALIFYYYPTKDSLFLEAWTEGIDELEQHIFGNFDNGNSYLTRFKKVLKSYIDFVMNRKEIMKLIEMDKTKIIESNEHTAENLQSLKLRYNAFIQKIETLIDEGKTEGAIPETIPTRVTANLIAESMNTGTIENDLSMENIVKFIMNGMAIQPDQSR